MAVLLLPLIGTLLMCFLVALDVISVATAELTGLIVGGSWVTGGLIFIALALMEK